MLVILSNHFSWLVQATFIKVVTIEVEKRQQVKVKVKAQWATEDKMRDTLKLPPKLGFIFDIVAYLDSMHFMGVLILPLPKISQDSMDLMGFITWFSPGLYNTRLKTSAI